VLLVLPVALDPLGLPVLLDQVVLLVFPVLLDQVVLLVNLVLLDLREHPGQHKHLLMFSP
jgi:hypothetical protein